MNEETEKAILWRPDSITLKGFDPARNPGMESLFSLGNGFMAVRGYPEEGTHGESTLGTWFQETGTVKAPFGAMGADWLFVRISVNGQHAMVSEKNTDYEAKLDFRTGVLTRRYPIILEDGTKAEMCFERVLGMEHVFCAAQRITVLCGRNAMLSMNLGVDGNIFPDGNGVYPFRQMGYCIEENRAGIILQSSDTELPRAYLFEVSAPSSLTGLDIDRRVVFGINDVLSPGKPFTVERKVMNRIGAGDFSLSHLDNALSFAELVQENTLHYQKFWQNCRGKIADEKEDAPAIRYSLFQLHQLCRGLDLARA